MIKIKDPISGFSHLLGVILSVVGTFFLLKESVSISFLIFGLTSFILYSASTIYHLFGKPASEISYLRKIDHASIYLLIAGTFTPFCVLLIKGTLGIIVLILIWTLAIIGSTTMFINAFWKYFPRWASTGLYILMGWIGLVLIYPMRLYPNLLFWILIGGIFYTIGAVIYAIKKPNPFKGFGFHELFHIFVLLGTISHFIAVYYLAVQPPST
ncbi:MAG: hemolysin III family protein [Candidatus Paceibacterota bacterium]